MKSSAQSPTNEKSSLIGLSLLLMFMSGGATFMNGSALYITLNRDSADYANVRGEFNRDSGWAARPRVDYEYEGEAGGLRSAGLLLTKGQLREIDQELGYIPVCVDRQHPWNAAVCHEPTAYGIAYSLGVLLIFLGSLAWFLWLIRPKKRSNSLILRKGRCKRRR